MKTNFLEISIGWENYFLLLLAQTERVKTPSARWLWFQKKRHSFKLGAKLINSNLINITRNKNIDS